MRSVLVFALFKIDHLNVTKNTEKKSKECCQGNNTCSYLHDVLNLLYLTMYTIKARSPIVAMVPNNIPNASLKSVFDDL